MRKTRFFALCALMFTLTITKVSWAELPDIVYHTMDFPNGAMGVLSNVDGEGKNGSGGIVRVNVYGDAVIYGYTHQGESRILLAEHSGYGLGQDMIYLFEPDKWGSPVSLTKKDSFSWDMRGFAYDDSYFYVANLMRGTITKIRIDDYKIMATSFDMKTYDTGEQFDKDFGHLAEDLLLAPDGYLYAMDQTYESYPLELGSGTIFKIDPATMRAVDWAKVGASPWDMAYHDGYIYVSCFGGSMFTNGHRETDRPLLQRIPTTSMRGKTETIADGSLINTADRMNGYMLLEVGDDGTLYATSYQIKSPFSSRVYVGNVASLSPGVPFTSSTLRLVSTFEGWSRASIMDRSRNLCWISDSGTSRNDSKLVAFNLQGEVARYSGSELGGYPNMLALAGKNAKPPIGENRPPSRPQITSPLDGDVVSSDRAVLAWDRSIDPDGDGISYRVSLRESGVADSTGFDTTTASLFPLLKDGTSYSWHVTARDGRGAESSSKSYSFTTGIPDGLLLPIASQDQHKLSGIPFIRLRGIEISSHLLDGLSPAKSGDITDVKISKEDHQEKNILTSVRISTQSKSFSKTYTVFDITMEITSQDLRLWPEVWDKISAPSSDQDAMTYRLLSRIKPMISLAGNEVDLLTTDTHDKSLLSTTSTSERESWFNTCITGRGIAIKLSLVVADGKLSECLAIEDAPNGKFFIVKSESSNGTPELSLLLKVTEESPADQNDYVFPSSTGCNATTSGWGFTALLIPLGFIWGWKGSKR
nr:hypothetical protein [uncultured Dethiosulfovibrio sp.]